MKVRDLRKRQWYVTHLDELCRYVGKVRRFGKVYYRFDVSSACCKGEDGYIDRWGIYFESVYYPARTDFIKSLRNIPAVAIENYTFVFCDDNGELCVCCRGERRMLR